MMLCIRIEQPANHALILSIVLRGLPLEELDAALAQSQRDLYGVFAKHEILGCWKEVGHYPEPAQGLIGVFDFRAHKCVCPFASNRRRVFG